MTKEQVIQLLTDLDIQFDDSCGDIYDKIRHNGLCQKMTVTDGASKICLIFKDNTPFVIKWSNRNGEAMREVDVYKQAQQKHLEMFFPVTEYLVTINSIEFVLQQKVDSSDYDLTGFVIRKYQHISRTALNKTVRQMEKAFWKASQGRAYRRDLSDTWAKMAIVIYGKRICKQLCEFIIENHINDLHRNNIGFIKNKPVILDFSGYEDFY